MAVNFATVADTLSPEELGFATISTEGLAPFSKVVHVKEAPLPEVSKSMGDFWADKPVTAAIVTAETMSSFSVFIFSMAKPSKRR
jgi:hypothetical protein